MGNIPPLKLKTKNIKSLQEIKDAIILLRQDFDPKNYKFDIEMSSVALIFELARRVQRVKARTYQGSWKKRGWLVSIYGNLSRKWDRIESIFEDLEKFKKYVESPIISTEETVLDTLIDLGNYCFLASTELMMTKPEMFNRWLENNTKYVVPESNDPEIDTEPEDDDE